MANESNDMKTAILLVTGNSLSLAETLHQEMNDSEIFTLEHFPGCTYISSLSDFIEENFDTCRLSGDGVQFLPSVPGLSDCRGDSFPDLRFRGDMDASREGDPLAG